MKKIDSRPTPLVRQICLQIESDIISKGYQVGDKLPAVIEWVSLLKVSDKTIQKAIAQLEQSGLLCSFVGKGTFLKEIPCVGSRLNNNRVLNNTIAVLDGQSEVDLTCEHTESWTTRIVHGMRVEAAANGIDLLLLNEGLGIESLIQKLSNVRKKIDGVVTFPFTDNQTLFDLFDKYDIPLITINKPCEESRNNFVTADYFEASKTVGALFSQLDCRHVWFLTTQINGIHSKEQRYRGLVEGLKLSGSSCQIKIVIADTATDSEGRRVVSELIKAGEKPDGIYCSGDYLAMGAIKALKDNSIQIGTKGGTSVIGSSGFEISAHIAPSLSVIQIPMIEMGRRAIRKILELREKPDLRIEGVTLPANLILRDSTPAFLKESQWLDRVRQARLQVNI